MENPIKKVRAKGWLKENFIEILTIFSLAFCFSVLRIVLLKEIKASSETEISIVETIKGIIYFIFGYWFGSSIGSKKKEEAMSKTNNTDDTTTTEQK